MVYDDLLCIEWKDLFVFHQSPNLPVHWFFFFLPSFTINVKILYVLNIQLLFPASWLDTLFFPCQDMADYKSKGKVGGGVSAGKAKSRDDDDDDDDDDDEEEEDEDDEEDD